MKPRYSIVAWVLLPVVVLGIMTLFNRNLEKRNLEYPNQMAVSPAYRSQSENPVLSKGLTGQQPVPGTIPRGFMPFNYGTSPEEAKRAGIELSNPFEKNKENLERGKYVYTNSCAVCHGASGGGDGPVIPKYPNPPDFKTETSKALADGELFHVITRGRNNMPPADSLISAEDRWKVILYIRQLQGEGQ
ncbi:MAG: cytochrome c [Acidobacteriota bacterium]|nr:cytochrome c [Acidobacteriota bacterium]MDH3529359.1 cytochrome c [Acidobacteriota bacterium]